MNFEVLNPRNDMKPSQKKKGMIWNLYIEEDKKECKMNMKPIIQQDKKEYKMKV